MFKNFAKKIVRKIFDFGNRELEPKLVGGQQQLQQKLQGLQQEFQQHLRQELQALQKQLQQDSHKNSLALQKQLQQDSQQKLLALQKQLQQDSQQKLLALQKQLQQDSHKNSQALQEQLQQDSQQKLLALQKQLQQDSHKNSQALQKQLQQDSQQKLLALQEQRDFLAQKMKDAQARELVNEHWFMLNRKAIHSGGISAAIYDEKKSRLTVTGWFLPFNKKRSFRLKNENNQGLDYVYYKDYRFDLMEVFPELNTGDMAFKLVVNNLSEKPEYIILDIFQDDECIATRKKDVIQCSLNNQKIYEDKAFEQLKVYYQNNKILDLDLRGLQNFSLTSPGEFNVYTYNGEEQKELLRHENPIYMTTPEVLELFKDFSADALKYIKGNFQRIAEDLEIICTKFDKACSLLEIGGIPPVLSVLLAKKGFTDITILDPNATAFKDFCNQYNIKTIQGSVLDKDVDIQQKFDLVIASEVIEHIPNDLIDLGVFFDAVVGKKGALYLTTPNQSSVFGLLGLLMTGSSLASKPYDNVYNQYDRFRKQGYYGHIREFTCKEIINFMEHFNFTLDEVIFKNNYMKKDNVEYNIALQLEKYFPHMKLFAKYIFRKKTIEK